MKVPGIEYRREVCMNDWDNHVYISRKQSSFECTMK